ncbi:MAG: HEPN domain-containing protein [Planctomycetia bacterium]|nr:HEPN domain-containing protein [Planctomycetia bacterium]
MKTSLENLPRGHVRRLEAITQQIVHSIPTCEKVILFGSYARGDFVVCDRRFDFGVMTIYNSDYDILVVYPYQTDPTVVSQRLDRIKRAYEKVHNDPPTRPAIEFHVMTNKEFNKSVREGRYFYMDILKEGILLHSSGAPFPVREVSTPTQFHIMAQEYFDEYFHRGNLFLLTTQCMEENEEYTMASFHLHQATEKLYHAVQLVFTLYKPKRHDLAKLRSATKSFAPELLAAFPLHTPEEKRLFDLLCRAYIEARYNSQFRVTKEEVESLKKSVELLRDIVKVVCEKKIEQIALWEEMPPQEEKP